LESVKDAIQDESESSDSSEADDEGGDDDDTHKSPDKDKMSPEASSTLPAQGTDDEPKDSIAAQLPEPNVPPSPGNSQGVSSESPLVSRRSTLTSAPSSPSLSSTADLRVPIPSPLYELDPGQERNSFLKALSGFWPQNVPHHSRADYETDDPIRDPEHIFRDSSMVVRTDEPTSIIALALK
jgi:1-phosphatidylinositol-3-phosphate 5-kinase